LNTTFVVRQFRRWREGVARGCRGYPLLRVLGRRDVGRERDGDAFFKSAGWLKIQPLWPEDRPHLAISEITDWFASYVYLLKLRDRVVLDQTIQEALGKLDAKFGYAESFDAPSNSYSDLLYAQTAPDVFGSSALIVRAEVALEHLRGKGSKKGDGGGKDLPPTPPPTKPRRFYGSVEIDMVRPVKSFDVILNSVILELQRTPGAKVKVALEIVAEAPSGFDDAEVGVVRDNAKQLKFRAEATGFED
jgi:uncharacterized protein